MSDPDPGHWLLRPLRVPGMPPFIELTQDGVTLGRDESCTHVIAEADFPYVSSHHARFSMQDGEPVVEDLGSRNGTIVNGHEVERAKLELGDIIQLGEHGPRFAAINAASAKDTLPAVDIPPPGALGETQMDVLRQRISEHERERVSRQIRRSTRTLVWRSVGIATLVAAALIGGAFLYYEPPELENYELTALKNELAQQAAAQQLAVQEQRQAWVAQRARLEQQRRTLQERLQRLEEDEKANLGEITNLREQLQANSSKIELFDPVKLEQVRLRDVARIHHAVVLIEFKAVMRELRSSKLLHVDRDALGRPRPNLDGKGDVFEYKGTGSGFCVSKDGHILTNAHVVRPEGAHDKVKGPGGLTFVPEPTLHVVFTSTDLRIPAELVRFDDDADLAVIRIEPFETMPVIEDFTVSTPPPEKGSEVYLFGFPLGMLVKQEGDRVVASTFKGILSRPVGDFLQIDAAVHPGNSGGPVTDAAGHVIGIVAQVQATPDGGMASDIGYVIPIAKLADAKIWPLK